MSVSQPSTLSLKRPLPLYLDEALQSDAPLTGKAPKIDTLADILAAARPLEDLEPGSPQNRGRVEESSCWRDFTNLFGRVFNYCCEGIAALIASIFGSAEPAAESEEPRIELLPALPENGQAAPLDSGPMSPAVERPAMQEEEVTAVRHFIGKWTRFSEPLPIRITKENEYIFEEWANDLCALPLAARKIWERVFIPYHKETIRNLIGRNFHPVYGLQICERTTSEAVRLCVGVNVADERIMSALEKILPAVPPQKE